MTSIEAVLSLIPSLNDKERKRVTESLREQQPTPCERLGHSYRNAGKILNWFAPPQVRMVCNRCGHSIIR